MDLFNWLVIVFDAIAQLDEVKHIGKEHIIPFSSDVADSLIFFFLHTLQLNMGCFHSIGFLYSFIVLVFKRFLDPINLFNVLVRPYDILQIF